MIEHDVVIVGGGAVGLSLACFLGKQNLSVLVLEAKPMPVLDTLSAPEVRVSSINAASIDFLNELGAWDKIDSSRKTPYHQMEVWDHTGSGFIAFNAKEVNHTQLGFIVENNALITALYAVLQTLPNVLLQTCAQCKALSVEAEYIKLTYEMDAGEQTVNSQLVVGADGAFSWVRETAQIPIQTWPYEHTAIIANVITEKPHDFTARQVFLPAGPLAFLPLQDPQMSSIVWSTDPQHAEQLLQLSEAEFCNALARAFNFKLGTILNSSKRQSFALTARHAKKYVQPRIALMGDAIHTLHPLAGQGLNLGLRDAKALGETLIGAREQEKDIGDFSVLRKYERAQKGPNIAMLALMEGFKRLFAGEQLPVLLLRNWGLQWMNRFETGKRFLIKQAMGL